VKKVVRFCAAPLFAVRCDGSGAITNAGNQTSPTGPWPTAATSRSSTGSMTIHDICSTLYCTAYRRVSGGDVMASFTDSLPASALTDNGSVYTSRFTHGHNDFERMLASLGIAQKNGHPGHRSAQGKIERFHQTLKRWLTPRPRPTDINQLQALLDTFRQRYNTARPHRALPQGRTHNRPTPHCPKTPPPPPPRTSSASAMTPSTNSANSRCATAADYSTSARAVGAAKPVDHQRGPPRGASPRRRESRRAGNSAGFGALATDRARRGTRGYCRLGAAGVARHGHHLGRGAAA
jgi:Integrase core domain